MPQGNITETKKKKKLLHFYSFIQRDVEKFLLCHNAFVWKLRRFSNILFVEKKIKHLDNLFKC